MFRALPRRDTVEKSRFPAETAWFSPPREAPERRSPFQFNRESNICAVYDKPPRLSRGKTTRISDGRREDTHLSEPRLPARHGPRGGLFLISCGCFSFRSLVKGSDGQGQDMKPRLFGAGAIPRRGWGALFWSGINSPAAQFPGGRGGHAVPARAHRANGGSPSLGNRGSRGLSPSPRVNTTTPRPSPGTPSWTPTPREHHPLLKHRPSLSFRAQREIFSPHLHLTPSVISSEARNLFPHESALTRALEYPVAHKISPHCVRRNDRVRGRGCFFGVSPDAVLSCTLSIVISSEARNLSPAASPPLVTPLTRHTSYTLSFRAAHCHFERREKSSSHSRLRSFHSGFVLMTSWFFFSRRHFLISFSLAMAAYTSVVYS